MTPTDLPPPNNDASAGGQSDDGLRPVRVCALGASAGGVRALSTWFTAVPPNLGFAYVVIVHLSPDHASELAATLQPHTTMPVVQVHQKVPLEPDHVYIIPPNRRLVLTNGSIEALEFEDIHQRRAPIDVFFRSLARGQSDSVAVILSGAGTDGAVGVKAIKEAGGLVLVQDPKEAEFSLMPRSAIGSGVADVVLPITDLAKRFAEISRLPFPAANAPAAETKDAEEAFRAILASVRTSTGHDFNQYKRTTLLRRVGRRMQVAGCDKISDYLTYLKANSDEPQQLLADMLISVTSFFRDRDAFDAITQKVIPKLFSDGEPNTNIRVWVPACATGEEAYSLAILLLEEASRREVTPVIQIFATDIDESALATAREGRYPSSIEADVSEERLHRFFVAEGSFYAVRKELRNIIVFASHSVLRDPPFTRLDLVSCRNLLIYLERNLQSQLCETFHYALKPGRYLFLGSAESAESDLGLFETIDKDNRIFQSKQQLGARLPILPQLSVEPRGIELATRRSRLLQATSLYPGELHRTALEETAPPSILVDEDHKILHISETAGRFIQPAGGPMSSDLKIIARPELRFEIQTALLRAFEKNEPTHCFPMPVEFDGASRKVALHVAPVRKLNQPPHAIVYFLDCGEAVHQEEIVPREIAASSAATIRELETELGLTRERLRANIEEYEASNEELRAANEELQSTNEEYRSTAEELETSKEELQSMNEELQTVNSELKINLERVSRANNDLQNLVTSGEIGTLFLDTNLKIKLFTPKVTEIVNIVASDTGRVITDFTHQLAYDDLVKDVRTVLASLIPIERLVSGNNHWYLLRLRPYRTIDNKIDGVVVTFIDVTKDREAQAQVRRQAALINLSPDAIIVHAIEGTIHFWSKGAQDLYGYSEAEAKGKAAHALLQTEFPSPPDVIDAELRRTGSWRGELNQRTRDGRRIAVLSRWRLEKDGVENKQFVLESNIDISERKRHEAQTHLLMGEVNHRAKNLLALVQVIAMQTKGGSPEFVERFSERIEALAASHDLLIKSEWQGVDIASLLRAQLTHFADVLDNRITLDGPPVQLSAPAAQSIGMALHELATNASKYGALSNDSGKIAITWQLVPAPPPLDSRFLMMWKEHGGPPVAAPKSTGFGTLIVETMLRRELQADVRLDFAPSGVSWRLECPARMIVETVTPLNPAIQTEC